MRILFFSSSLTSKNSVHDGVDEILKHFGKIDILMNNAGLNHRGPSLITLKKPGTW